MFASTLVVGHHLCRFVFVGVVVPGVSSPKGNSSSVPRVLSPKRSSSFHFDRTLGGWAVSLYLELIAPTSCFHFRVVSFRFVRFVSFR